MNKRLTTRQRMEREVWKYCEQMFDLNTKQSTRYVTFENAVKLLLAEHRRLRARVRKLKGRPTDWTNGEWNAAIDAVLEAIR